MKHSKDRDYQKGFLENNVQLSIVYKGYILYVKTQNKIIRKKRGDLMKIEDKPVE